MGNVHGKIVFLYLCEALSSCFRLRIRAYTAVWKIHYYVLVVVYAVPPIACKLVILLSFLEINDVSTMFRWSTYSIMFVVFGYGTGILISGIFQCMPVQSAWDFGINGTCIDRRAAYKANAILGVITDVMIILLPLPTIIALRISTRTKIGLLVLFLIGSMYALSCVARTHTLIRS